ncbi:MAG: hypothetical protein U1E65_09460 [Myxococcota bacterium]
MAHPIAEALLDDIFELLTPRRDQLCLAPDWEVRLVDRFAEALRSGGSVGHIEAAVQAAALGLREEQETAQAEALIALFERFFGRWRPASSRHSRVA